MEKIRHYEFEGVALDIPLRYDSLSKLYIEEYPDFSKNPVFTREGCPVMFAGEDACGCAEASDGAECPDCGCCRYFRPADVHTWIGVCGNEEKRRRAAGDETAETGGMHREDGSDEGV